ncbi:hypothetical protein D3C85_1108950 [compost metagenome]
MRAIVSAGEIGVSVGDSDYLFRPSLAAIDSLGSPAEIVTKFGILFSAPKLNPIWPKSSYRAWERELMATAYDVLAACSDKDVMPLLGHMGSKWGSFVPGPMPSQDMVHLARALMRHGVVGLKPEGRPAKGQQKEEYSKEFNAREFVAQATAHLGLSSSEAWQMTMTEFSGAMQSKFGKPETLPPAEEHDDAMARLAEINRLRQYQVKK